MTDSTLFDDVPWEYTVAYVDKFTGRRSYEWPRRSLEVAQQFLAERQKGNDLWADSVVVRRRRTDWEDIT